MTQNITILILTLYVLQTSFITVSCHKCDHNGTIDAVKRPIYKFSTVLLDKLSEEYQQHFVFSPLATWLQLTGIGEGARGRTLLEILKTAGLMKYKARTCYRRNLRRILSDVNRELSPDYKQSNVIVIDKLLKIKDTFVKEVQLLQNTKVMAVDFSNPEKAAEKVNEYIEKQTNGVINEAVSSVDFNEYTYLSMIDTSYFNGRWKNDFDPIFTDFKPFYNENGLKTGTVNMMSQTNYFNIGFLPAINTNVIELPFDLDSMSMLIFLPAESNTVQDVFANIKHLNLKSIFSSLRTNLVNVSLPRFEINTDTDIIAELLIDMGVKELFDFKKGNLNNISDFKIYTPRFIQIANIEVTEKYVAARHVVQSLVKGPYMEFNVNKPFVFMIVHKEMELIYYAGVFSEPLLY